MSEEYKWSSSLELRMPQMDADHAEIFRLFDMLGEIANGHNSSDNFLNISHRIKEWSAHHFAHEESLMEMLEYSQINVHKQEHAKFIGQITRFIRLHRIDNKETVTQFQHVCSKWYCKHIMSMDIELVKFLSACDAANRDAAVAASFHPFTEGTHNYEDMEGSIQEWRG